jgi:hypothetical protein
MYPSKDYPFYGIFVKNFENQLIAEGFEFEKAVIKGRGRTKLEKLKKYFQFFVDVFKALLIFKKNSLKPLVVNAHGSDLFPVKKIGHLIQKIITPIIKKADMVVVSLNNFIFISFLFCIFPFFDYN